MCEHQLLFINAYTLKECYVSMQMPNTKVNGNVSGVTPADTAALTAANSPSQAKAANAASNVASSKYIGCDTKSMLCALTLLVW